MQSWQVQESTRLWNCRCHQCNGYAWSSLYAGLRSSRPPRRKLMRLGMEQMPTEGRPLLAGDHTAWSRSYARTLKDRTIEHQPTQIAGNKPIAVGTRV